MRQPGHPGVAGPPYTSQDQSHGPCYVLCPRRRRKGERLVLAILEPPDPVSSRSTPSYPAPVQIGTRRVVVSPPGRPLEWRLDVVPVYRPVPAWHTRARRLRAQGLSYRAIALDVDKHEWSVRTLLKG
jgi:hypothetical protein